MHYDDVMVTPMSETGGSHSDVYIKPTEAELMTSTLNLIGDKDPFEANSNFFLYVFLGVLCAIMVGFMVFILRMRKTKLLSEEDDEEHISTSRAVMPHSGTGSEF